MSSGKIMLERTSNQRKISKNPVGFSRIREVFLKTIFDKDERGNV